LFFDVGGKNKVNATTTKKNLKCQLERQTKQKSSYDDPRSQINKSEQRDGTCKKKKKSTKAHKNGSLKKKKKTSQKISEISNCNHPPSDYHKCT